MMNNKILFVFLGFSLICTNIFAKKNGSWTDINQDSIQINSPIEFIDTYDKYIMINKDQKIKLVNFGDVDKKKNEIKYTLKKYGVQVLNNNKVYNVFTTTTPNQSNVDLNLLYHDKSIAAFRVRDNSLIDYVKKPFRSFVVNAYVYNFKSNQFSIIPVINSESNLDSKKLDLLQGDQMTFDSKKGVYTYLANIKNSNSSKIREVKVTLNSSLKCISATIGCEMISLNLAEKK